jgi:hypothetical protein
MKANPFVFMMNKAKYESMVTKDVDEPTEYMRVNRGIDQFNQRTEFPFEPA